MAEPTYQGTPEPKTNGCFYCAQGESCPTHGMPSFQVRVHPATDEEKRQGIFRVKVDIVKPQFIKINFVLPEPKTDFEMMLMHEEWGVK